MPATVWQVTKWSAWNDQKWKSRESAETCLEKFVKSLQVNLFLADFSNLKPLWPDVDQLSLRPRPFPLKVTRLWVRVMLRLAKNPSNWSVVPTTRVKCHYARPDVLMIWRFEAQWPRSNRGWHWPARMECSWWRSPEQSHIPNLTKFIF